MKKTSEQQDTMSDLWLARVLIARLNGLLREEPSLGVALFLLCVNRVELPDRALVDHPTIQVAAPPEDKTDGPIELGFLGMLNGIVGVIKRGKFEGWGYVTAVFEDGRVTEFRMTTDGG